MIPSLNKLLLDSSQWLPRIGRVNRALIYRPPVAALARQRMRSQIWNWRAWYATLSGSGHADYGRNWTTALNLLGAECLHRSLGQQEDLQALRWVFEQRLDRAGNWKRPIESVRHAMQGYSLLYLAEHTGDRRYITAADELADTLKSMPRAADGCLPYSPDSSELLVDTLAMICPFLARYARITADDRSRELAVHQLQKYIEWNLDDETALPFHGYVAGGARRLGLLAWGRGVGWYLLGIVDTLSELDAADPNINTMREALLAAFATLIKHQRPDGHWNWAILHPGAASDSSTTSLVGYAMQRAQHLGIGGAELSEPIRRALQALIHATFPGGTVGGGLGECRGLGIYPQNYGPQPWLQGSATAFGALLAEPEISLSVAQVAKTPCPIS